MDESLEDVVPHWSQVIDDMHATAERYREDGWRTVELHPGDVTVLSEAESGRFGLDVLVPGEEFERLQDAVADREFDAYEVFRGETDAQVFGVVALTSSDGEVAAFVPFNYDRREEIETLRRHDGTLFTHVRRLENDQRITFSHENPEPFFPD